MTRFEIAMLLVGIAIGAILGDVPGLIDSASEAYEVHQISKSWQDDPELAFEQFYNEGWCSAAFGWDHPEYQRCIDDHCYVDSEEYGYVHCDDYGPEYWSWNQNHMEPDSS